MTVNVYGIDLAEDLNFCGIVVGSIDTYGVHLGAIRKFNKVRYPQITTILQNDLFPKLTPTRIVTDYTSEKSFSEELESKLNPLFLNPNTPYYNKWKVVKPYIFSQSSKLALYQNMRRFIENGWFKLPELSPQMKPETWALIQELEQQIQRVIAVPTHGEIGVKFPKPVGYDDDLVIALALMLDGAGEYFQPSGGQGDSISVGLGVEINPDGYYPELPFTSNNSNRLDKMIQNITVGTTQNVKVKTYKDKDWWT